MKFKNTIQILMLLLGVLILSACDSSNSTKAPVVTELTGNIDNGRIYYFDNCSTCHAAGVADGTTALGGTNLKGLETKIQTNMEKYGGSYLLMSNFVDIPPQRVVDLKAFLTQQ